MSDPAVGLLMLGLFIVLLGLGFPIAFTMMAMGVGFGYYAQGNAVFQLFVQKTYGVMANDVLISVPLFVFMGYIVERANILDRLFRALQMASGNIPGALGIATLATCALFATATGIVGATVTLMGLLAFPAMLRAGYDARLAAGIVCAGGTLGILIPPSVMLILYGATAGVSVVKLYAGAFIPGFLLAGMYMLYTMFIAVRYPERAPRLPVDMRSNVGVGEISFQLLTGFLPLSALIFSVLGAILFGWATPSEAAAMGSAGALILAAGYRFLAGDEKSLTWQGLKESVFLTARTSAMVCWLFVGSAVFSATFGYLGGQQVIEKFVLSLDLSPLMFLLLAQVIIFLLGWPLEWTEIIVIFIPIFVPLLKIFDVDPLFFGILIALNLQTSFLSPPVAMAAFYLKGVAPPHVTLAQVFSGVIPFMLIVLVCMVLLYMFPGLALWLPSVVYK